MIFFSHMDQLPFHIQEPSFQLPNNLTVSILKNKNALPFHQGLAAYCPTPLISLGALAKAIGLGAIYIKDESYRFDLNAFKGLGASFAIGQLLEKKPEIEIFCTATDGNHGRAVAWAAKAAGKKSVVFVPADTSLNRIKAIEKEGATVVQLNKNYDDTCAHAERISKINQWELVQDTAWKGYEEIPADIMAGYLTHFKELEDSLHGVARPDVDLVFLQVGVGSWAASAAFYYLQRYGKESPLLITVEPDGSAGFFDSLKNGERVSPESSSHTIMGGLSCGIPSLSGWEMLKNAVTAAIRIPDEEAKRAMRQLYVPLGNDQRVISGESGAAGLAGLLTILQDPAYAGIKEQLQIGPQTRILLFNTEGNTDEESFEQIIS
ncbi:Diaminopropionate ammonia-lyase [Cecembia lonarensis LW9]|uniref:Diaminopropionate ammonia-lyase n=2 Tax=Cecembia TaxID=1187078 RepID=K1LCA8_CECL9|nr:Diaminopropionate ammonia-lyase [Cecembia lonarensis LW9]